MNDSKYRRLYPERAVAPARKILQEMVDEFGGPGALPSVTEALAALDELGFPEDEPLLLLRGQDELAAQTVMYYAQTAAQRGAFGGNRDTIVQLESHAERMRKWRPRRLPD